MWCSVILTIIFVLGAGNLCYGAIPSYYIRIYKKGPSGMDQRIGAGTLLGEDLVMTTSSVLNSKNNASQYYLKSADDTNTTIRYIYEYNPQNCDSYRVFLILFSPISSTPIGKSNGFYNSSVPNGATLTAFDDTQLSNDGYIDLIKCTDSDNCVTNQLKPKNALEVSNNAVGSAILYNNQYVGTLSYQGDLGNCSIKTHG